ncbi:conserved phage C-terminal domain-containing protein [Sutcliffiella cohnii]
MAKFRQVHTSFWQDPRVLEEMTPEDKYFYLYLLTNPNTTQIGIYQITKKQMAFDLGYSTEAVNALLERFINIHKIIKYNPETREIALLNWAKYNLNQSGKPVLDLINKELKEVKDQSLLDDIKNVISNEVILSIFQRHGNGASTGRGQEEEIEIEEEVEEEIEEEKIPYVEIVTYLNNATNSNFRFSTQKTKGLIKARWNEGFRLQDFIKVIDIKVSQWLNDPKMNEYLRPPTLFGTNFESYLNQKQGAVNSHGSTPYDNIF